MTEESGSIAADVKVTYDSVPDVEAGAGGKDDEHPLEALKKHSAKFHEEKVRPLLEQAGNSLRKVTEIGATKTREIGDSLKKVGDVSVAKSREIGAVTVEKSRSIGIGTQLATAAAVAHTKHTISQIGSPPVEKTEDGEQIIKGEETDWMITSFLMHHLIQSLAVLGGVAALVTFILMEGRLVDMASFITIILAPLVFWQKMQLNALGGMRGQINEMRATVNRLKVENSKLEDANTQLQTQVDGLKDVETKLNDVAMEAGAQVDRLVYVVQQNGEIQKKIKAQLEDEVAQQIMTALITTDRDGNFVLNRREVYELEMKLNALPAVHFDKEKFRAFLESDKDDLTLSDLSHIVHNLKDDTIPESEKIFHFEPLDILEEVPPPVEAV
uniref:Uncharacterized protein n=1 Tax=Amphora coffeiformis TaxID=265554 RepID=A0A7S3LGH9_9STRA|mmetsp:Transcript_11921/g.22929  ORF Transcript_11921/g.22929 Transcript_11921/m.22929 type:complete len:385 (+) Transcript_11921:134-1288(+)